jgi:hypothetical protein
MTEEIFQQAADAHKRIEFYAYLQKLLNASGVSFIIHPEIQTKYGGEFVQVLKDDILPSVDIKLEQARKDLDNL